MTAVFVGLYLGLLMASVFISLGAIMLFMYVKSPTPTFSALSRRMAPSKMVMGGIMFAYPFWSILGILAGFMYWSFSGAAPGRWLASPNGAYTAAVIIFAVMATLPLLLVLKRVAPGVLAVALVFAGLYGWALPYFAE
ncbi:MAG: hypothetical protein FJ312_00545 [SAR202 cluster bacterium]|nr:hypothetical protein [SAR202 cluster bacterium]